MHLKQKLAIVLAGSALLNVAPAEASFRLLGRGAGAILAWEAWQKREETSASWERFSKVVQTVHEKHAHSGMGSCDQLAATAKEMAFEIGKYRQEKPSQKTANDKNSAQQETTVQPSEETTAQSSVGKIICEDGSYLLNQGFKAIGMYLLIKGK